MMNGRRVATARGAILADAALVGAVGEHAIESLFEPRSGSESDQVTPVAGGRGAAWFIQYGGERWVLRHYRRGGFIARLSEDRYFWAGESRVRAFAEYRMLAALAASGMPVPAPVAARYVRHGLLYSCDLITLRIPDARSMGAILAERPLPPESWARVGAAIARLHRAGADHADLNAHNILIDSRDAVSVVDFDRGRIRGEGLFSWAQGSWAQGNLSRLRHSLEKISAGLPADRFSGEAWRGLLAGYGARRD
jgi:3-deoxy-D-manno-octulosonic acid kinase